MNNENQKLLDEIVKLKTEIYCLTHDRDMLRAERKVRLHKGMKLYAHPLPAQQVPEGYVLMPRVPTDEMLEAYFENSLAPIAKLSVFGYRAMLSAAPKPEDK